MGRIGKSVSQGAAEKPRAKARRFMCSLPRAEARCYSERQMRGFFAALRMTSVGVGSGAGTKVAAYLEGGSTSC
jgi:hypothetical protein